MNRIGKEIIVDFEKIGHNGVSIGRYDNKVVFSYGVLPGEKAKIIIFKEKKDFIEGEFIEIIEKSPYRIEPEEAHYLSCSPWQTFDYNFQVELKKKLIKEIFFDFVKEDIELNEFFKAEKILGYRTKIEYSFVRGSARSMRQFGFRNISLSSSPEATQSSAWHSPTASAGTNLGRHINFREDAYIFFAFHKRGDPFEKVIVENGCLLFGEKENEVALELLEEINRKKLENLKSLVIRRSLNFPYLHFSLFVKDKNIDFNFEHPNLTGFALIYSNPQSPASVITEILKSESREEIIEKIGSLTIKYHYSSFFQNNIELFEKALFLMKENLEEINKIVDLYCGAGVIGLYLAEKAKRIIGVDVDKKAIEFAKLNAEENGVKNFEGITLPSEKIDFEILKDSDVLILDPPRSGLHKKVINLIRQTKPKKIFYLSCNPITQARDYNLIKDLYQIEKFYGLDFYPNTPHLESLLILLNKF